MLAHPSGSAFAESSLRNAFAFLRRIYRFRSRGTRDPTDAVTDGLVLRSFSEGGFPPMTVSLLYDSFLSFAVSRFEIVRQR